MNKKLFKLKIVEDKSPNVEDKCRCGDDGIEAHTCPYAEEIGNDSETLCNCCDYCSYQCAMDV